MNSCLRALAELFLAPGPGGGPERASDQGARPAAGATLTTPFGLPARAASSTRNGCGLRKRLAQLLPGHRTLDRPAVLQWPDGHCSAGTVRDTPAGPVFTLPRAGEAVLAGRGWGKPDRPQTHGPTELAVTARPRDSWFVPRLPPPPSVAALCQDVSGAGPVWHRMHENGALSAVRVDMTREDLRAMVRVAGGSGERLAPAQQAGLQRMLSRSLFAVAPQCADPAGARSVARALAKDHDLFLVSGGVVPRREPLVAASFDAASMHRRLAGLVPGESLYIRVLLANRSSAHAAALAACKQADGRLRLSLINPMGWRPGGAIGPGVEHPGLVVPGLFRTVTAAAAAAELAALLDAGDAGPRPCPEIDAVEEPLSEGRPLLDWFAGTPAARAEMSADFHGAGVQFQAAPQKCNDCTIECMFAYMATALRPPDYKLAKAAGLNGLLQAAVEMKTGASPAEAEDLESICGRLRERMTSSLAGGAVASAAVAQKTRDQRDLR